MNTKKQTNLERIFRILMTISAISFGLSLLSQMYICNQLAVKNTELRAISEKRKELAKEISTLSYENSSLSTLKYVDSKAKELGFVKITSKVLNLAQTSSKPAAISQR